MGEGKLSVEQGYELLFLGAFAIIALVGLFPPLALRLLAAA